MPNLARNLDAVPHTQSSRVTDNPIDYSIPYKSREKGAARHYGFFPFFAKKPWPVIQEYINHYTSPGDLVGDPFSGSGVTPVESLVLGRRAAVTDINPVARFITRMTAIAPVDLGGLKREFEYVRSKAQQPIEALSEMSESEVYGLLATLNYPRTTIPATVKRAGADTIDQLHTPRQLAGLTILRDAINQVTDDVLRDLLFVGLCRTIRYANRTYDLPLAKEGKKRRSAYAGNANFLRRFSYSLADQNRFYEHPVWAAFEHTIENVFEAKAETNRLIGERYNSTNFVLGEVPASRFHEITGEGALDYCFTDPPYSNDIYFLDLSVLWAAWLGFEITDQVRHDELIEGGIDNKSRQQFESEFAAAMESVAKALKQDHWFTLVYKHRDLSLWQNIVAACENSGLRYVNSVWQDVRITSTRQIECPNINPKGDMYLNFRKMSRKSFETVYPKAEVIELPTRPNYLVKEIERFIVSYLGADITLITSSVIQQILDSRAFRDYHGNPASLQQDIRELLRQSPIFTTWQFSNESFWVLSSQARVDPSISAMDRARYYVFELLREQHDVTEGEVSTHLLTKFSNETIGQNLAADIRNLLRQVGTETDQRRWHFDEARVTRYKQLRLFFQTTSADHLRERIQERNLFDRAPLQPDYAGLAMLYDHLHQANLSNTTFETQWSKLLKVLKLALQRLSDNFADQIETVLAFGEWAEHGIDLRNTPFEDVLLQIVLRAEERPLSVYQEIADKAFINLNDEDILLQFLLLTNSEWQSAVAVAQSDPQAGFLGIPILNRI